MKTRTDVVVWLAGAGMGIWVVSATVGAGQPNRGGLDSGVIPRPVSVEVTVGRFEVNRRTRVVAEDRSRTEASRLVEDLATPMGWRLPLSDEMGHAENRIWLRIDSAAEGRLGTEGYELEVTPRGVDITAAGPAGLFYGGLTLRQLMPPEVFGRRLVEAVNWVVPSVRIVDYPRFQWRGLLIDPARHFIPVVDVERFIDVMAMHKLNRLQMHLTDNEGWRIQIRKYPKLTELGSTMDWSLRRDRTSPSRCFGFYSQQEIRSLVRYAADRHITIVPEIEMPYHTGAAIVAYPELGLNADVLAKLPPEQRWDKAHGLIAPRPQTVAFFHDVLTEVIELFPSPWIHIGGDEANIGLWAADPQMQAQMKDLGLADAHALHSWFITQMDAFLTERGRRLVGWDEILQGGLAPGATVMSWRGTAGGIAAARASHDVVMAPTSHTYFDYRQATGETGLGGSVIDLARVYSFEPIPDELGVEQAGYILGGQGQLWGELIADRRRREFMAFPRGSALSEVLWSPRAGRDFQQFSVRLARHLDRLRLADVNYRPPDGAAVDGDRPQAARTEPR